MSGGSRGSRPADAQSLAAEGITAAAQLLTLLCWCKGNSAWRGTLALLFLWLALRSFRRFDQADSGPSLLLGAVWALIGLGLLVWFAAGP